MRPGGLGRSCDEPSSRCSGALWIAQEKLGWNFLASASAFAKRSLVAFLFGSRRTSVCTCRWYCSIQNWS